MKRFIFVLFITAFATTSLADNKASLADFFSDDAQARKVEQENFDRRMRQVREDAAIEAERDRLNRERQVKESGERKQGFHTLVLPDLSKQIGALMCLQPEGGENWVLGVVRRFSQEAEGHAHVGIKALSRQARSVELRPRSSGFSTTGAIPGICLLEGDESGEIRLAMPLGSFDVRESLEFIDGGKRYLLSPIELETSGSNYEIGRYRQSAE